MFLELVDVFVPVALVGKMIMPIMKIVHMVIVLYSFVAALFRMDVVAVIVLRRYIYVRHTFCVSLFGLSFGLCFCFRLCLGCLFGHDLWFTSSENIYPIDAS